MKPNERLTPEEYEVYKAYVRKRYGKGFTRREFAEEIVCGVALIVVFVLAILA